MPQVLVAMEVSPKLVRLAILETTLRKAELVALRTVPLPAGATQAEAFALVKQALPPQVESIVVASDPRQTSIRPLRFPFGDVRKVEAAIEFELEGQVPYDIQEAALTWQVTQRTPQSLEIVAAMTPKKALAERLTEATAAGLEPRAVIAAEASLAELVPDTGTTVAIVSLGETTSELAIVRSGLRFARTLRAGGVDVDWQLARVYGIELAAAKDAKEREARLVPEGEAADPAVRKLSDTVSLGLNALVTALGTTFKSLPAAEAPQRLLITGGLSRLPGLADYLARRLGLQVELLDLQVASGELSTAAITFGPEYATVLGMALGLLRHGRSVALNFRRGEFAYQGDLQLYRGHATRLAIGLAAVVLLAIIGSVIRFSVVSSEERRLDQGFCEATRKIVGRPICDPTAALATMRQTPGAGQGVVIPPYSAAALFEMISKDIPTSVDVTFDDLELRVDTRAGEPHRITGKGEAASFEATEQIVQNLKRDPCVQEAEVSKQRKARDSSRVEFNLAVKVTCPAGTMPGSPPQAAMGDAGSDVGAGEDL